MHWKTAVGWDCSSPSLLPGASLVSVPRRKECSQSKVSNVPSQGGLAGARLEELKASQEEVATAAE